ncbi:AraC family transcriptional regulator [Paenibacillus tengchongensis]|uniref:AraC family transcriptional regulator n=1 Tax=Paenibacillus tengchongensis TaxID=2608684 RepID=UPI0016525B7F|nr:AraC family transcriptional regulator [Paenibacillus tengchongensis]
MERLAEYIRQLFFTYNGFNVLEIPVGGYREWTCSADDEAAFLFVDQHRLKATLQGLGSQSSDTAHGGEFLLIPPRCSCMLQTEGEQSAKAFIVRFSVQGTERAREALRSVDREYLGGERIRSFRMPQARNWLQDFAREAAADDLAHYSRLQSHLYMILSGFIASLKKPKAAAADLQHYVEHAREYISKRYHGTIDIEELARASGVSSSRFYRAFRLHTGLSPLQYTTSVRLHASMQLLSGGASSVVETAHAVGYPDEHYFSRLFKKQLGLSASDYSAAARRKVVTLTPVFLGDLAPLGISPQLTFGRYDLERPEEVLARLREAGPERILTGPVEDEIRTELETIAPTTVIRWKGYPWKQRFLDIAGLLELTPVAERWLELYSAKVANAGVQLRQYWRDEPVLLAVTRTEDFVVFGRNNNKLNDLFYRELGLTPPKLLEKLEGPGLYSLPEIADMDCGNIMIMVPSAFEHLELARLEQEWRRLGPRGSKKRCLFISYHGVLNYNAACYENLVDQSVWHIRSRLLSR